MTGPYSSGSAQECGLPLCADTGEPVSRNTAFVRLALGEPDDPDDKPKPITAGRAPRMPDQNRHLPGHHDPSRPPSSASSC